MSDGELSSIEEQDGYEFIPHKPCLTRPAAVVLMLSLYGLCLVSSAYPVAVLEPPVAIAHDDSTSRNTLLNGDFWFLVALPACVVLAWFQLRLSVLNGTLTVFSIRELFAG